MLVDEIHKILQQTGNTFIDEITEHLTDFVQRNLMTELALDPSDESLLVSREKVNGHMYHMFKDGQVALPEPLSILSEEQIRSAQLRIQESSGIVLSPQVLQPMFRAVQSSSEGEGETPCGSDQGLEQLADVSGSNVEVYAEEEVNTMTPIKGLPYCTGLGANKTPDKLEERIAMAANEVRSLLRILDNQTYACRSVEALQKLRRTLTEMCSDFSNSLYNTPSLANYGRKRSASTKDMPALKKTA